MDRDCILSVLRSIAGMVVSQGEHSCVEILQFGVSCAHCDSGPCGESGTISEMLRRICSTSSARPAAIMSRARAWAANIADRRSWISSSFRRPLAAVEGLDGELDEEPVGTGVARLGEGFDTPPVAFVDADMPADGLRHRRLSLRMSAIPTRFLRGVGPVLCRFRRGFVALEARFGEVPSRGPGRRAARIHGGAQACARPLCAHAQEGAYPREGRAASVPECARGNALIPRR